MRLIIIIILSGPLRYAECTTVGTPRDKLTGTGACGTCKLALNGRKSAAAAAAAAIIALRMFDSAATADNDDEDRESDSGVISGRGNPGNTGSWWCD